jgi:hypothetical protein
VGREDAVSTQAERPATHADVKHAFEFGVIIGAAVVGFCWLMFTWGPPQRPQVVKCVEWRELGSGIFRSELRCERWSDGKTRADVLGGVR